MRIEISIGHRHNLTMEGDELAVEYTRGNDIEIWDEAKEIKLAVIPFKSWVGCHTIHDEEQI